MTVQVPVLNVEVGMQGTILQEVQKDIAVAIPHTVLKAVGTSIFYGQHRWRAGVAIGLVFETAVVPRHLFFVTHGSPHTHLQVCGNIELKAQVCICLCSETLLFLFRAYPHPSSCQDNQRVFTGEANPLPAHAESMKERDNGEHAAALCWV